jgi:glutamine cyclotransferase
VAVATGNSTSGGTDIINETDGTVVHLMSNNGVALSQIWENKVAIADNQLYMAVNNASTNLSKVFAYYGVHGLGTETTALDNYRWDYEMGVGTIPTLLGTSGATSQINSLVAAAHTSTIDGKSNTIYVGSTSGLTVLQENQSLGNKTDGTEEQSGSVKYYTKDYISEEMVGDIRGMYPLSANGALSVSDASYHANTLTNTGSVTGVSGVRGAGASFSGSNYLTCTDVGCTGFDIITSGSPWAVGAWIKTTTTANVSNTIISKMAAASYSYDLFTGNTGLVRFRIAQAGGSDYIGVTSNRVVNDDKWHHIVGVWNGGASISIYIDGVLDNTSTSTTGSPNLNSTGNFSIGTQGAGGAGTFYAGSIDEPFVTATTLSAGQIKHMYEVGTRALQSHGTGLGGGAADTNQQLGYISTGTNVVGDAQPDYNNQFMYVGTNSTTLGALSKIQLNSDTNIKTYNSSANVPSGGPLLIDEDTSSLAVGNTLEAVGSAASGVKSMGVDNNATATSGNFVSKTFTLPKNIASAVVWVSPVLDSGDGSNTLTVKASNDGGSNYATCTLVGTDSSRAVPEKEYACTFTASNNSLKVKFEFARGSTKTNTYVTQYGITWLGQTGFRIEQADANNVRLYNYSGETQNLKLNVTGAAIASANSWTDGGGYLYPTGYEQIRVYDGTGTNYLSLHHDGTYGSFDINGTDVLNIDVTGNILPETNDTQNLGSDTLRWQDIYTGPGTIHIGTSTTDEYTLSYNTTNNYLGFNVNGSGNPEIVFDSTGSVGVGTTAPQFKLDVIGTASISGTLSLGPMVQGLAGTCDVSSAGKQYYDGPENKFYYCNGTAWTAMGSGSSNWTLNTADGTLYPNNFATVDVLIGGSATSSAKFAFKNMLTGTGTPSFIPGADNAYDLGASPSSRFRNLFLGPESLHIQAKTTDSGYSGLGLNLDYALGINTSGRFTTSANGTSLTALDPYSGNFAALGVGQFGGITPVAYSRFGTASTDHSLSAASDLLIQGNIELDGVLYLDGRTIASSNGTSTITFPSDPTAVDSYNLLTNGSWLIQNPAAGNPGIAALMVNQTKDVDIFTASASGISKFTIDRLGDATASGNITMGGQLQLGRFASQPTAVGAGAMIFNTTTNTEQCYNGSAWYNCGGTLYSNTNASVADGSYITVTHNLNTTDLLADSWINSQSTWKLLDATYQPAIAWEGKDTEKGVYHNNVNSYVPTQITTITTASLADGLLYDTFEDTNKTDSANTTASLTNQKPDDGATNYTTLQDRIQGGRTGLIGGQTYSTSTTDNDGQTYLGSNTVNDTFYYDRSKDSSPEVLVELGIDPNWYNGVTLSVATTSAQFSQNSTVPEKNPNLSTTYNGSLIRATGTDSTPQTIYITIKSPTTIDWTNYNGDAATGVTMTPGTAQTLGATGVSVTFSAVNYNTGDAFKIASWFIEAEGTTRGAKQQFPERSHVVVNGDYTNIIDADTQKLWMQTQQVSWKAALSPDATTMLNGHLYIAANNSGSSDGNLRILDFVGDKDRWVYENNMSEAIGARTDIAARNTAGSSAVTITTSISLVSRYANDVSAAVIPNAPTQEVTVSGWGYIIGNNTGTIQENVNLPYKFNDVPRVTINPSGAVNSVPTSLTSCSGGPGGSGNAASVSTASTSTPNSSFVAYFMSNNTSSFSSSFYYCYTWTATGTVSPKQFVAVATGSSGADGGTTIINETDGTSASVEIGSTYGSVYWQNKVVLTDKGDMYLGVHDSTANLNTIDAYYGIAGITSSETSIAQYRSLYWGVGFDGGLGPTVLGVNPDTNPINSLVVTKETSTMDGVSNTIYVGTNQGLSVIQEKNYCGNAITIGYCDGYAGTFGSVKYYTKDYISEEMVGDIRGMWPLNNANSSSDFEDVSIKAETLTGTNITANGDSVSGVRGTATDFDGSTEYMSCTDANCGGTTELDYTGSGGWSYGAWVKPGALTNSTQIISKLTAADRSYSLDFESGTFRALVTNTAGSWDATRHSTVPLETGKWYYVVVVYNPSSNLDVYVNGQLTNGSLTGSIPSSIRNSAAVFELGGYDGANGLYTGSIDEPFVTATTLSVGQIKHMYEVGYRALQSHGTGLGGGAADTNQQLASATASNVIYDVAPDYNNQYMYVGQFTSPGITTTVSRIQLNSDSLIKTFSSSSNTPSGGPTLLVGAPTLGVGENLEIVSSASNGVKSMGLDNNATATSGNFVSKTFTLPKNIASAVLWVSPVLDSSDGSNTLTVKASNDGGSNYATCTLVGTDSARAVPEKEYACTFTASNNSLKVKFEFARGSTKTNTYVTQYGITWLGQTGFRIEQADANNVRLYNYSGETQNLKLNVTGASTAALANPWTDGGAYLYPTGYETIRAYNGAGTHYLELGNDGSNGTLAYDGTTYVKISSAGSLLPGTDNTQSIGATASARWKDIFLGPGSLHLQANTADSGYSGLGTNLDYAMKISTAGTLNTSVNGTNVMSITQGGNVGIGTTNPKSLIQFGNYGTLSGDGGASIHTALSFNTYYSGGDKALVTGNRASKLELGNTGIIFYNSTGTQTADAALTTYSEVMRISTDNRVGIGTTNPAQTLDVNGNIGLGSSGVIYGNSTLNYIVPYNGPDGAMLFNTNYSGANGGYYFKIAGTNKVVIDGTGYTTFSAGHNDLAENYLVSGKALRGSLVSIGQTQSKSLVPSDKSNQATVGIVSTAPGAVMDEDAGFQIGYLTKLQYENEKAPIALQGTTPTLVTSQNGAVNIGDAIGISDIPGYGAKMITAGQIVGKALEKIDTNSCSNVSSIDLITWPEDDGKNSLKPCFSLPDGTYVGKIMVTIAPSWYDPQVYLTDSGNLNIVANDSGNYQTTDNGTVVDRIGAFGQLLAANIKAGAIVTQKLVSQNLESGYAKIETLIAQQATILNVNTKLISPIPGDDLAIELSQDSRFKIQDSSQNEVASIDSEGNATFAGEVHAQNIDDIQALLNQVQTDQSVLFAATSSSDLTASTSANLASLITSDLYVTNQAAVNSLSVSSSVTIGGDLVIGSVANPLENGTWQIENTLDTLSYPLRIQSLAMAPVEIMAGLVTIDTSGNVMISGNLAVKGEITTQKLTIKSDVENGPVVASIDASGSAVFSDIQTGKITGSDKERGSIDILPAEDTKLIEKIWESTPAAVFVSPSYNTQAWVENTSLNGFTIRVSTSPESEVQKLYWWALW